MCSHPFPRNLLFSYADKSPNSDFDADDKNSVVDEVCLEWEIMLSDLYLYIFIYLSWIGFLGKKLSMRTIFGDWATHFFFISYNIPVPKMNKSINLNSSKFILITEICSVCLPVDW